MASNDILKNLKERDVKAGRGYINDIGEYVSYEKEGEDSSRDEGAAYMPPGGTAAKSQARIDKKNSFKYKMAQKATADAAKAGRQTKDIGADRSQARQGLGRGMPDEIERRQKAMRSEYFPQTGTRSDEEKGFFSGMYDKTVGEYQRGQVEKERLKEETKAAMAAEPDPIVKKEIARKGHAEYMKIAATEGQGERGRETAGREALVAQRVREAQQEQANKDARVKGYKDFSDEASLNAQERARRGEGGLIQQGMTGGSLEDLAGEGSAALTEMEEKEQRKYGGVGREMLEERHQREKGLMNIGSLPPSERAKLESAEAGGERMDFDDPSIAGRGSWRGKEEELGGKSVPFTKEMEEEMGGISLDLNEKENRELLRDINPEKAASLDQGDIDKQMTEGMAQDEEERAVNEEFTQDQARDAISTLDPEQADAVADKVKRANGSMSEEHIEVKEAMRDKDGKQRYVRYEGSGLVINMSMLEKDIKRNENMAMLKHIPAANRPAMLVEWGYIDPGDLSTMQKKSAKQLKEESLLDLKIANAEIQKEKLTRTLDPKEKIAYDAAHKGMLDAAKTGKYGLADMYRKKINELNPDSDTTDYEEVFEKGIQRNKKLTPQKIFTAAGLPDGKPYWKSRLDISKAISLYKGASKAKKAEAFQNITGGTVESGPNAGENYGNLLKAHGIYAWEDIKGSKPEGVPPFAMKDEEAYMNWALPEIKNSLLKGIWGNMHTQLESMQAIESEKIKKKLSDQFVPKSSTAHEDYVATDHVKVAENKRKDKVQKEKRVKVGKRTNLDNKLEGLNWYRTEGGPKQRKNVPLTKTEMYTRAMKEGGEEMTKKFLSKTVGGRKAAKFKSLEEAVKYFKDPKNAKELEKESPSFQHFISKK